MKFSDLEKGVIYEDDLGTYKFKRFAGHNIAEFSICEYFEDKGEYSETDKRLQFNQSEVKYLRKL
jgi:hypothetical protein